MIGRRALLRSGGAALVLGALPPAALADTVLKYLDRPEDFGTPLHYFDRLITPTSVFFVRSHFGPPSLRRDRKLRVAGLVERPFELGLDELRGFEEVTLTAVLQCAGNGRALHEPRIPGLQWAYGAMGQATWTGVRLRDLLARAGTRPGAAHVAFEGADRPPRPTVPRYRRGLPIARALDADTLIAYRMNGEPLTLAHGAPFRLVVPGWTGNHWLKWLVDIQVQAEPVDGFWMQTAYRWPKQPGPPGQPIAPADTVMLERFPTRSLIARPLEGSTAPPEVVGVAFSGEAAIAKVELRLDDQPWVQATLEGAPGLGRWQIFRHTFKAAPGVHRVIARATDERGGTQPETAIWNPSGYVWNAWHSVSWSVA